jgi:5'-3' exonuclease
MNCLLILDCHYLCHRAFHSQSDLSWKGIATGVIYGFLKSIGHLKTEFQTDRIAFCFEDSKLHRKTIFPDYKMKRIQHEKVQDPVKLKARGDLCRQIDDLRIRYLPRIGFRNVLYYPGYESDDIMARISKETEGDIVLVTSDADMYQCLAPNVTMFSPQKGKLFTDKWFRQTYGIEPKKWAMVKAIAGCHTDGVPGIKGVGEATALQFIKGGDKKREAILSNAGRQIVNRNRQLVELPYLGTPVPEIREELISNEGWNEVCRELGIGSLMGRPPVWSRRILVK